MRTIGASPSLRCFVFPAPASSSWRARRTKCIGVVTSRGLIPRNRRNLLSAQQRRFPSVESRRTLPNTIRVHPPRAHNRWHLERRGGHINGSIPRIGLPSIFPRDSRAVATRRNCNSRSRRVPAGFVIDGDHRASLACTTQPCSRGVGSPYDTTSLCRNGSATGHYAFLRLFHVIVVLVNFYERANRVRESAAAAKHSQRWPSRHIGTSASFVSCFRSRIAAVTARFSFSLSFTLSSRTVGGF